MKKPYVKPVLIPLKLTEAEKTILKRHSLARSADHGEARSPDLKAILARIVPRMRESRKR